MLTRLGTFQCHSGALIVSDPCYAGRKWREDSSVILRLAPAITGSWDVWHEWIDDPEAPEPLQSRGLIARSIIAPALESLIWNEVSHSLCQDIGHMGIFDKPFFDKGLAPFGDQIRQAYLTPEQAWIGESGANSMSCYDPSRAALSIAKDAHGQIIGARTIWFSGCIRPREWIYQSENGEVTLHLDEEGLWAFIGEEYVMRDFLTLEFAGIEDQEEIRNTLRIPPKIWDEIVTLLRSRGYLCRLG